MTGITHAATFIDFFDDQTKRFGKADATTGELFRDRLSIHVVFKVAESNTIQILSPCTPIQNAFSVTKD